MRMENNRAWETNEVICNDREWSDHGRPLDKKDLCWYMFIGKSTTRLFLLAVAAETVGLISFTKTNDAFWRILADRFPQTHR